MDLSTTNRWMKWIDCIDERQRARRRRTGARKHIWIDRWLKREKENQNDGDKDLRQES